MITTSYLKFTGADRIRLLFSGTIVVHCRQQFERDPGRAVFEEAQASILPPFIGIPREVIPNLKEMTYLARPVCSRCTPDEWVHCPKNCRRP